MKTFAWTLSLTGALLLPLGSISFAADPAPEADEVTNDQMVEIYEQGRIGKDVWVVDSRPTPKFVSGHIPGAVGLPLDVLNRQPESADKVGAPKNGKVVFYCAGRECTLSIDSAAIFRKLGYTSAWVYRNGVPGWNQKAQPLQAEESFVAKGNLVLLDPVPGAKTIVTPSNQTVQLSVDELKSAKGQTLLGGLSKNTPLVVLSRGDMAQVNAVLEELREMDFRRLAYFAVGAWKPALAAAPAVSAPLAWAPVYAPGQVSPKAFEAAVASGKYILDVRPTSDFDRGHFQGAVSLPIEDMERDFAKVPRDVPVYVNCATGAKSQKTYDILGRKGFTNISYLDAEINCKGTQCTIKE